MRLFFICLLLFCTTAFSQTYHIEAENFNRSFGVLKYDTLIRAGHQSWVDYSLNLTSDGIYQITMRMAGLPANIWITDTNNVVLGKMHSRDAGNELAFRTLTSTLYLKASLQRLRIFFSAQAFWMNAISDFNWFELKKTNLLVSNDFDSDWLIYQPSTIPFSWSRSDSLYSLWESSPGFYGWIKQAARPGSIAIFHNGSSTSDYNVLQCELKKSDTVTWPNVRAELYKGYSPTQTMYFRINTMSTDDLSNDGNAQTMWQTHGACPCSPPFSLQIANGRYLIKVLWSAIYNPTTHQGETVYDVGPYVPGIWVKWVIKVKWAWDNTGQLQVWKDNNEVVTRLNLPNCYNEDNYPYFKFGIYKWGLRGGHVVNGVWHYWAEQSPGETFTQYYDSVRIGGENSSLAEMEL